MTSYPNQPFEGEVSKIEPQALDDQTVTTFSVLIVLGNENGLLRPGMNADVEIRIAERLDVPAVRTAALRINRDISVSSELVGLAEDEIRQSLRATAPTKRNKGTAAEPDDQGYRFRNEYWVLVEEPGGLRAVTIETGLTDLDYSEVLSGLKIGDEVLLLPSSGLILSQQRFQAQMRRFMSMPGMNGDDNKSRDRNDRSSR